MKKRISLILTVVWLLAASAFGADGHSANVSPTEGTVTADFVAEPQMKADLLQMLANFAAYMKNDFQDCVAPNSVGETCGCFRGENTMANDEKGVRPNADLSMICAFLAKYGKDRVVLPAGVAWTDIEQMAMKSLVFAYSTHKANKLKVCAGNNYWGSTSNSDAVWESSLWAMSVAYSAFFQWDKLSDTQKNYIYKLLKAECNYELQRSIPTGYAGDTKAEENGWEADVLAATLGLFPNDALAPKWYQRLREFAINSYSQKDDANDRTVIDPAYDQKTVKDLYRGANLYDDFTLQNHNYFHTSYQNVVIQELGEAALALKLFQNGLYGEEKWKTNALMHNNDKVMQEVLYWLALADGELAMPNGNDWSLFLYDQITSYSTNACFLRDPHALMLENLAYQMIKARQTTTDDGSWLLRADVGARRMGVEAHRVMMTWLMHEMLSTADMAATSWDDFCSQYSAAKVFTSQNIVRASTPERFTCFSWSNGLKSYTGYMAPHISSHLSPSASHLFNLIVPFRANNTGNFIGWYEVGGKGTNATPVVNGIYQMKDNAFAMNGELATNDGTLDNRFAIYSTPGNAVVYLDDVRASSAATISREKGGLMAISVDDFTATQRTFYTADGERQLNGATLTKLSGDWVNIDNQLGIVACHSPLSDQHTTTMAFGERANNNSVLTARFYAFYNDQSRNVQAGDLVDSRGVVYYSNVDAATTQQLSTLNCQLSTQEGWKGMIAFDPDNTAYLLLSNFTADRPCALADVTTAMGAPVFSARTEISGKGASADFVAEENHSVVNVVRFFIDGSGIEAMQDAADDRVIYLLNLIKGQNHIIVKAGMLEEKITLNQTVKKVMLTDEGLIVTDVEAFPDDSADILTHGYKDITESYLANASFELDETYGKADGNVTVNGVTYNPCYVNTVAAANAKWPNILPVRDWTAANQLSVGSNFCRMYSMPYSQTQYCVSPSNVGNYAARCSRPISDAACGDRVLTVLNSWDSGSNAIRKSLTLPAGKYRVLMDVRYECPNQTANSGSVVTTSGGNTCTSLTGVAYGSNDFRYPTEKNSWQQLCFDFTVSETQPTAVISLGYKTSAGKGAADNTLMYIDNVRLLVSEEGSAAIQPVQATQAAAGLSYDLQGKRLADGEPLHRGIVYIKEGRKVMAPSF